MQIYDFFLLVELSQNRLLLKRHFFGCFLNENDHHEIILIEWGRDKKTPNCCHLLFIWLFTNLYCTYWAMNCKHLLSYYEHLFIV